MVKISVVMPVYGVEAYLGQALDSVLHQDMEDFEVLCIDDASPDRCPEILDAYAEKDGRVRVIHLKENHGQGYARNLGIEMAEGEYLYLMDPDDMIIPGTFAELYEAAKKESLDAVCFEAQPLYETEEIAAKFRNNGLEVRNGIYPEEVCTGSALFDALIRQNEWICYVATMLLKKDMIRENHIGYTETKFHEDEVFAFEAIISAKRVRYVKKSYFIRRYRADSLVSSVTKTGSFYGYLMGWMRMEQFCLEHGITSFGAAENQNRIFRTLETIYENGRETEDFEGCFRTPEEKAAYRLFVKANERSSYYLSVPDGMLAYLRTRKKVYIYGAGNFGIRLCRTLSKENIAVDGFLVSSMQNGQAVCMGHRVYQAKEIRPEEGSVAVVAVGQKLREEIEPYLSGLGWDFIYCRSETPVEQRTLQTNERLTEEASVQGLQEGMLNWYPFAKTDRVLLVQKRDSYDLSELLAQRCNDTKVVSAGEVEMISNEKTYDVVVVTEPLEEDREEVLAGCKAHLKENGRLLWIFKNRYGLKYFCGAVDEVIKEPYAGLLGETKMIGKKEAEEILDRIGLAYRHFYSLLPDETFPQLVLREDYEMKGSIRDRVFAFEPYRNTRNVSENALLDGILEGGLLPELADCLLVEASVQKTEDAKVLSATISTDRDENGFVTVLLDDRTVLKRALKPEGAKALRIQAEVAEKLNARGIPSVLVELCEDGTVGKMPLVEAVSAIEEFRSLLEKGEKEGITALFDRFREDLLRSSEQTTICEEEARNLWGVSAEELGVILRKGYADMIPYNAFIVENEPMYYDQEFVMEDCPLAYILYRILRYTYLQLPRLEELLPLRELKVRYGLLSLWDVCAEKEDRFVQGNRRMEKRRELWQWRVREEKTPIRPARLPEVHEPVEVRSKPYPVGLLMGVFDLYHQGHLNLIRRAKEQCDYLRVGVLSDALVEKFKQITPTIPLEQRMEILKSVRYVDEVVVIDDDPSRIKEWHRRPFDCFFSGDDYAGNEYWAWEKQELKKLGADLVFFRYSKENSSSRIRQKLKEKK